MKIKVYLDPNDIWVGVYRGESHWYVLPLPFWVIRIPRRCGRRGNATVAMAKVHRAPGTRTAAQEPEVRVRLARPFLVTTTKGRMMTDEAHEDLEKFDTAIASFVDAVDRLERIVNNMHDAASKVESAAGSISSAATIMREAAGTIMMAQSRR
jgi:predicted transcriptional regulator